MNRHLKLITALLSIIFCFSLLTLTVWAADLDGDGYDDETGEYIGVVTDPVVNPVVTDPVATDPPYVEPETEAPYVEPETEAPYAEPATDAYDYNYDNDSYDDQDSEDIYADDSQTYDSPANTVPPAALYESDREIDDSELSSNDWDDIKANLSNASSADGDADDFSFIKDNDSTSDNGEWMLIAGIVCLLLSVAGIIYVIASTVSRRKKVSAGIHSPRQPAYVSGAYSRSDNDYDDGYRTSSKEEKKKVNRSRKYDTAEVKLPKSGTRYKNGGRRYK